MNMTVDQMIAALKAIKDKVGGDERIPIVLVGCGENDYIEASYPVVGDFCDQYGETFKCALVGDCGGEEFTRKDVPHYRWEPEEDKMLYGVEAAAGQTGENLAGTLI